MAEITDPAVLARLTAVEPESDPWYEDIAEGFQYELEKTGLGIKDLASEAGIGSGVSPEQQAELERLEGESLSLPGIGGRVLSEASQMMVPMGPALKGAKMLKGVLQGTKAAKLLPRATQRLTSPVTAASVGPAGHGVLKLPEEGESRLGNAAEEAIYAYAGQKIGKKMIEGISKSPAALQYLKEGGYLTPGMAASGKLWEGIEGVMSVFPGTAKGTQEFRALAGNLWNKVTLNKALPPGMKEVTEGGRKGIDQLRAGFKKAYEKAWGKAKNWNTKPAADYANRSMKGLPADQRARLTGLVDDLNTLDDPKTIDRVIRKLENSAPVKDDDKMSRVVKKIRAMFRHSAGKDTQKALKEVDAQYPKFLTAKEASSLAAKTKGVATPAQVAGKAEKVGGRTGGTGSPLQEAADIGMDTVGRPIKTPLLNLLRSFAVSAPSPMVRKGTGQAILGQTKAQKYAAKLLREHEDKTRALAATALPSIE